VGYPRETKGYYFYNYQENKVFVAWNVVFLEKEFLSKEVSGSTMRLKEVQKHKKMFQFPLMRRYNKMSQQSSLTNMLNPNHEDQYGPVVHLRSTHY
jgi:hypothetical protein